MVCLLLTLASNAQAGLFSMKLTKEFAIDTTLGSDDDDALLSGTLNTALSSLLLELETQVNKSLPETEGGSTYFTGMANASVASVKGMGGDYANDIDIFLVGPRIGLGADLGENKFSDLMSGKIEPTQIRGFGVQPSLTVGFNLGVIKALPKFSWMKWNNLKTFVNFFSYTLEPNNGISGSMSNFGMHFRYKIMEGRVFQNRFLAKWGGLEVHTGFDTSKLKLGFSQSITETMLDQSLSSNPSITADVTVKGTAGIDVEISNFTIPIEISTNIQLLYILTLYGGLGLDLNFASASGSASLTAPVDVQIDTSAVPGGASSTAAEATAALVLGEEGDATTIFMRGFGGLQLNLSVVKVYFQFQKAFNAGVLGVSAGLNIAW